MLILAELWLTDPAPGASKTYGRIRIHNTDLNFIATSTEKKKQMFRTFWYYFICAHTRVLRVVFQLGHDQVKTGRSRLWRDCHHVLQGEIGLWNLTTRFVLDTCVINRNKNFSVNLAPWKMEIAVLRSVTFWYGSVSKSSMAFKMPVCQQKYVLLNTSVFNGNKAFRRHNFLPVCRRIWIRTHNYGSGFKGPKNLKFRIRSLFM